MRVIHLNSGVKSWPMVIRHSHTLLTVDTCMWNCFKIQKSKIVISCVDTAWRHVTSAFFSRSRFVCHKSSMCMRRPARTKHDTASECYSKRKCGIERFSMSVLTIAPKLSAFTFFSRFHVITVVHRTVSLLIETEQPHFSRSARHFQWHFGKMPSLRRHCVAYSLTSAFMI